jgi:Family of unknown function (DUF5670)
MPVLRLDYAARQAVLSGVRQVAQSCSAEGERSKTRRINREIDILWTIVGVPLILWLLGFSLHVAGGLIHLLLVVVLVMVVINLLSGRRTA